MKECDILSKYYSIHEFSKIIGVSAQTLRNWDVNGVQELIQEEENDGKSRKGNVST